MAFVRVVEANTFAAAARGLGMSASGVSRAVSRLETQLGVRLLARTTRSLSLTEEGRAFYDRCQRILADLNEATESVGAAREHPQGRLRVASTMAIGRAALLPHLPEFNRLYPDIRLELSMSDQPLDMVEEGIDCALRIGQMADSSLIAKRIGQLRMITCASPDYLRKHGYPRDLSSLREHDCIGYVKPIRGVIPWYFETEHGREEVDVAPALSLNDAESVMQAGIMGLGIIQTTDYVAASALARGELVPLFPAMIAAGPPLWIVYPQRRHVSARVQVFIDWICQLFDRCAGTCTEMARFNHMVQSASMPALALRKVG
ncbi:LysR family transcriptional regulator [Oleiagrimonas sp. C23AA]|uniref:LysR family transcriptional regulator n=1 Tax=Oleiagrimonas sp. C23AA TaxID=2719047 RepID=UPI0014213288|nr:LysR family transcriptional regulator [Oleiagrimonas sp. C23AA]NII12139.1 LysR family transcriptional regulator [Oleiagrimonas sp. C23AA]